MRKFRGWLYLWGKILGDLGAVQQGKVGQRVANRVTGKVAGRALGKLRR